MSTLTEFLLARIAEDEKVAREAGLGLGWDDDYWTEGDQADAQRWHVENRKGGLSVRKGRHPDRAANAAMNEATHIARHDPARVLAECEAKRRIVQAADDNTDPRGMYFSALTLEWVVEQLALPYADHPDYQEEWKP